jgi:hypothetical protein
MIAAAKAAAATSLPSYATSRKHGPAAGHRCLAKLIQGTVCKILNQEEINECALLPGAIVSIQMMRARAELRGRTHAVISQTRRPGEKARAKIGRVIPASA